MKSGFSLLELLIVMALFSTLTLISYSGYQHLLTKARRSHGPLGLFILAQRMETYYQAHHTYRNAQTAIQNETPQDLWYHFSIYHTTKNTYELQATPQGSQALQDTVCQSFTLNHQGEKNITKGPAGIPTGTPAECW